MISMKFKEECKNVWRENAVEYINRPNKTGRDTKMFFKRFAILIIFKDEMKIQKWSTECNTKS